MADNPKKGAAVWYLPVKGAMNADQIVVTVSEDLSKLQIIQNVYFQGVPSLQWAITKVPLQADGEAHSVVVDTKKNEATNKQSFFDIDDGTLHYSVVTYNGKKIIALKFEPYPQLNVDKNGDGFYDLTAIATDNPEQYAVSVQNLTGNLVEALVNAGMAAVQGYFGNGVGAAGSFTAAVSDIVSMQVTVPSISADTKFKEALDTITTKGFNAYFAANKEKSTNNDNNDNKDKNKDKTKYGSDQNPLSVSQNTMLMMAGFGILALLFAFVVRH